MVHSIFVVEIEKLILGLECMAGGGKSYLIKLLHSVSTAKHVLIYIVFYKNQQNQDSGWLFLISSKF